MNKQFFTLMLSAAIFTTPLFAMVVDDEDSRSGNFQSLSKREEIVFEELSDESIAAGLGDFKDIPSEGIVSVIDNLTKHDVNTMLLTSKAMYEICETPALWRRFAKNLPLYIDPVLNMRSQLKDYYFLFSNPYKDYPVSKKTFLDLIKMHGVEKSDQPLEYHIGNKSFWVENLSNDPYQIFIEPYCQNELNALDEKEQIIFHASPDGKYFKCSFQLGLVKNGGYDIRLGETFPNKAKDLGLFIEDGNLYAKLYNKEPIKIEKTEDPEGVLGCDSFFFDKILNAVQLSMKLSPEDFEGHSQLVNTVHMGSLFNFTSLCGYTQLTCPKMRDAYNDESIEPMPTSPIERREKYEQIFLKMGHILDYGYLGPFEFKIYPKQ
ncbi:MAG: F-box protein [Alphaproteobacteria bacterium]|nr:F-box protein [Alphaproteobacteria bacterium]